MTWLIFLFATVHVRQSRLSQEERMDIPSYTITASQWLDHDNADSIKYSTNSIADSDAEMRCSDCADAQADLRLCCSHIT